MLCYAIICLLERVQALLLPDLAPRRLLAHGEEGLRRYYDTTMYYNSLYINHKYIHKYNNISLSLYIYIYMHIHICV